MARGSVAQHFSLWQQNRGDASAFAAATPERPKWPIVIRYYAALHLAQAALKHGDPDFDSDNHKTVREAVRYKFGNDSADKLRRLLNLSYDARYDAGWAPRAADTQKAVELLAELAQTLERTVPRAART